MKSIPRFLTLAFAGLSPVERQQLKSIGLKLLLGLVASTGLLTYFVVVPAVAQTTGQTPPTTAAQEIKVVAREPGVGYNVAAFCNDPTTGVGTLPATDNAGTRYIASRGTEQVNWPDTGASPVATHYWTATDGTHQQEAVEVTKDAAACLRKKAGMK